MTEQPAVEALIEACAEAGAAARRANDAPTDERAMASESGAALHRPRR
jgi:hypothetical protein